MNKNRVIILLAVLVIAVIGVFTFSSITATECTAKVLEGTGTVKDPLKITVYGNSGLTPLIDSLLPFKAVPAIELSYEGERFYIPGLNNLFEGHQLASSIIYITAIIVALLTFVALVLRGFGLKLKISRVNKK